MKFNIEDLKNKKQLYGIYLDSKNPSIIDFNITNIFIESIFGYKKITFELSGGNNDYLWYTTIYDHFVNNEAKHNINTPFKSHLTNMKNWEPFGYNMYNFLFSFSKTLLKKQFKKELEEKNNIMKEEMENLNDNININKDKINKIDKKGDDGIF